MNTNLKLVLFTNLFFKILVDNYVAILYEETVHVVTPRSFTALVSLQGSLFYIFIRFYFRSGV